MVTIQHNPPITAQIHFSLIMGSRRLVTQFTMYFRQHGSGNAITLAETIMHVWGIPIARTTGYVLSVTIESRLMLSRAIYAISSKRHAIHVCLERFIYVYYPCVKLSFFLTGDVLSTTSG